MLKFMVNLSQVAKQTGHRTRTQAKFPMLNWIMKTIKVS